ncbi:MAG TPA: hypothetical protein VGO87_01380 [Acidimicrobiia bacterium]
MTSRQVLDRWAEQPSYSPRTLVAYWEWAQEVNRDGPPDDAVRIFGDDELMLASLPGTNLVVSFLVSVQDRVVIVKDIT